MDTERTALYAAEFAAFEGTDLEQQRPFAELQELTEAVVAGEWWPGPKVTLRRSRADARSSSTRCSLDAGHDHATIRLAAGQMTTSTVAHELAHALAGITAGHGDIFRAAYLDMVAALTNTVSSDRRRDLHVGQLRDAFLAAGLQVGNRRWPPPPPSTAGAIAL